MLRQLLSTQHLQIRASSLDFNRYMCSLIIRTTPDLSSAIASAQSAVSGTLSAGIKVLSDCN